MFPHIHKCTHMTRILAIALILLAYGCNGFLAPHKVLIQQGNHVDQKMVNKLEPGMSKKQVKYILGTPMVTDAFDDNSWHYISTLGLGNDQFSVRSLTLVFEDEKLAYFTGDFKPSAAATPNQDNIAKTAEK